MVIRTEYKDQRYSMGSSNPLPAGFEIRFGSLDFQATGNGYLMCITNRDELRPWRSTGLGPVPVTPTTDAPAPAQADAEGPQHHDADDAPASAPDRRGWNDIGPRASPLNAMQPLESVVSMPQFPHGMRNAAMAYTSSAGPNVAVREGHPGRHVPAARNLAATTDDESYHGSTSELPPTTSHGYAEWDFSGVPDSVMFQWFLDTADYWFGYSDNSSAGSYDPARECFVVITNDQENAANMAEAGNGEVPLNPGTGPHQGAGPSRLPPHRRGAPTSTRS
jgi:hypothetical protein